MPIKPAKKAAAKRKSAKRPAANGPAAKRLTVKRPTVKKSVKRDALARLREVCLALPEALEVEAWGEPTFRVRNKLFAIHASTSSHHGGGRRGVWIASTPVSQDLMLRARPDRYFKPPYVGPSGWIGVWLDRNPLWGELTELLRDAYRLKAPKKLAATLED